MDPAEARDLLHQEQERLQSLATEERGVSEESEDESLGEYSAGTQHQADIGTETFDRERDLSILEQVEAELADVQHALGRLDDGTYGRCEVCGRPIGDERLQALPAARYCVDHQAEVEASTRSLRPGS